MKVRWSTGGIEELKSFKLAPFKCGAVYLNGEPLDSVFAVDEAGGRVWRYKRDEHGKYFLRADGLFVESEMLTGVVRLEISEALRRKLQ